MRSLDLRDSGIGALGKVEWGAHVCMFYNDERESLEIVAPYFAAGLKGNEFCMWVTSKPLTAADAKAALQNFVPDLDDRIRAGQMEIMDSSEWYTKHGRFNADTIMKAWVEKLEGAIKKGFAGLRLCGYTSWLAAEDWEAFIKYEDDVGDIIEPSKVLALCSYPLAKCDARRVIDVVSNHHFAVIKKGRDWTLIQNAERAKAVIATKEVEKKYRRTADNIGVAIYSALADETSTTLLVTDRIEEITGYSAREFYLDPGLFGKIVHPDDLSMVWEKIQRHRKDKSVLDVEYRIVRKDGTVRWVKDMAQPSLNRAEEIERIDGFMEDITERRWTEKELRDSRERFALAQKAAKIGSWDWDITTGSLAWSDEIEPMFGFGPGEFERTYEAFLRCVHPDDRQKVEQAVKECVERGSDYSIDHRVVSPSGVIRWISEKGNVVRDSNGKAVRMLGIAQDVTESKQSEQRINELNRELEAFAYSVSHDLRAPLRRIEGFGNLLLEDAKDKLGDSEKDYLSRISSSISDMNLLIEGILKLSRVSSSAISVKELDLAGMAAEVVDQLRKSEPSRRVSFRSEPGIRVRGDRVLLMSVLDNLLGNAWKFTRDVKNPEIELGTATIDGSRAIFVKDNGAGFDPTYSDKLFKPFQRLHSSSEFPGNGVGLAIVKRIVERHGGKVWAEGAVSKGATFYFTLGSSLPT